MAKLKIPAPQSLGIKKVSHFLGADFSESSNISFSRSPDTKNMIRETPGKVRKWIGYETVASYQGQINGVHFLNVVYEVNSIRINCVI